MQKYRCRQIIKIKGYDQAVTVLRLRKVKLALHMVPCTFVQTLVQILPCRSSCVALHDSLAKLVGRAQQCISVLPIFPSSRTIWKLRQARLSVCWLEHAY